MWTQGILSQTGTNPGYETWENGTISDAKKIHAINPKEPVMGYYGFPGCCYSHYAGYYENWLNQTDLFLKDDNGVVVMWETDGKPYTPMFDWCNPDMFTYFTQKVIAQFMNSSEISGVFFDECDAYVEGPQAFWYWGPYNFSESSQTRLRLCFENAMVNVTKYMALQHNKWAIPSSNAYNAQFPDWSAAQSNVVTEYGGFKFVEWLNCFGTGYVVNVTNTTEFQRIIYDERKRLLGDDDTKKSDYLDLDASNWACPWFNDLTECCQTQILTCMNISENGGALMIRGGQNEDSDDSDRYFQVAAFLFMANEYSYFAGGQGWGGVKSFPWFNIYDYPIGKPLGATEIGNNNTIFVREFEHVFVTMDLTQSKSYLYFNWP